MPTLEEIKKIANKIARSFVHPNDHTSYREQTYRQVEAVITQLSKDYAIVPKSKLKEIDHIVCGTFSIGNMAVRQSWEYVKRKLFEEK